MRNQESITAARSHHTFPSDRRRTAIRLYQNALDFHAKMIPHCGATRVDFHRSKLRNLQKLIATTEVKL